MKKFFTAKHLSLLMLLSLLGGNAQAARHDDEDRDSSECCSFFNCYECGCNPLYCGAWDLQFHGGGDWTYWRNADPISVVNCTAPVPASGPVIPLFNEFPKFDSFYTQPPWTIGGQVGYHMTDNIRFFVEFDWSQTKGKNSGSDDNKVLTTDYSANYTITPNLKKYQFFEAYFGGRYYWDRWCDRVSFFLGAKIGLTHHYVAKTNNNGMVLTNNGVNPAVPYVIIAANTPLFNANTVVSGGGHGGFDFCFWGNWSLVVTGEVVASAGPNIVNNILTPNTNVAPINISNIITGKINTELRFPVTGAIRYSF